MTPSGPRHQHGILDTSTLILLTQIESPEHLPLEPLITTITLAELSVGPLVATDDNERVARQAHLQQAEADFTPLPFDADAARTFGRIAASLRRSGRKAKAKVKAKARAYDAMIAAIALGSGHPIYTCNPDDFAGIDELTVVAIPVPH